MNDIVQHLPAIRADLFYALGILLALGVTVHVLLRKREVASSVGWIGLAWFAPIMGSIAYFLLGVNRVQRRALRERAPEQRIDTGTQDLEPGVDDHLDAIKRGIDSITGRPVLFGNHVQTFENGDQAYPSMLEAIAAARHSVGLSTFIFHDDVWGGRFIEALTAAKDRGLDVRVLVDGIGGGWLTSPAYHALRRHGVVADRFLHSPLPWRMPFLNLRSHKKILVLDGTIGFTGGMNISDANVMATHPPAPVQDTHFRIEGPVIRQLTEAFVQDWTFATGERLEGPAWFPDHSPPTRGTIARVIDSGPDEDIEKIEFSILQAVACARTSVQVMTPYFLPDDRLTSALSMAAMRGIAIDIVIPTQSDHRFVDWACHANLAPMLKDGVRIWRSPPPFRHSKLMVVDDEWCLIGSCNWDIRSFRLNFELCMELYDRDLAATLTALMLAYRGPAVTMPQLDARSLPIRLRDAAVRLALPYL